MHYQLLAVSAFAAAAVAQGQHQNVTSQNPQQLASVVSVLETALPSTLLAAALTNPAAVSNEIASEFAAGETPSWFTALPTAVQTYLVPAAAYPNATGSFVPVATGNASNVTTSRTSSRGSSITTVTSTSTARESPESSASPGRSGGSSTSSGGASMATAMMGMSLAGAVGLVGVLAL